MAIEMLHLDHTLTVRELKEYLSNIPEEDEYGNPAEIWIVTGEYLSSGVTAVIPLNKNDILLEA